MMLTPDYLTTNQSEECPGADHTPHKPPPHPIFKNLSLKAFREFGHLSTSCPDSLLGSCNKHHTFLHHNLVSVDWLYCMQMSRPEFGLVTLALPAVVSDPPCSSLVVGQGLPLSPSIPHPPGHWHDLWNRLSK